LAVVTNKKSSSLPEKAKSQMAKSQPASALNEKASQFTSITLKPLAPTKNIANNLE